MLLLIYGCWGPVCACTTCYYYHKNTSRVAREKSPVEKAATARVYDSMHYPDKFS